MSDLVYLRDTKRELGNLLFLDFRDLDIKTAHYRLGIEVKRQVQNILIKKINNYSEDFFLYQMRRVKECICILREKILSPVTSLRIRQALNEYLECLTAWAEGADLHTVYENNFQGSNKNKKVYSALDLALLLQNDNSGCQTGLFRAFDHSIYLWHTEEDVDNEGLGHRFDKLRVAAFRAEDKGVKEDVFSFIYPDLLPGAGYSWRSDFFVQAVDALYLKPEITNAPGLFSNIVNWLVLRMGPDVEDIKLLIDSLCPYIDGCIINIVKKKNSHPEAFRFEFAGDKSYSDSLSSTMGGFLYHTNIFSQKGYELMANFEDLTQKERSWFTDRVSLTKKIMNKISKNYEPDYFITFLKMLSSVEGGEKAYSNINVKSYFLCHMTSDFLRTGVGAGPALGELPIEIFYRV